MWIGVLALAGIPPFSGFWSKDSIIEYAYELALHEPIGWLLFAFAVLAAACTIFYSLRLMGLVFYGPSKTDHDDDHSDTTEEEHTESTEEPVEPVIHHEESHFQSLEPLKKIQFFMNFKYKLFVRTINNIAVQKFRSNKYPTNNLDFFEGYRMLIEAKYQPVVDDPRFSFDYPELDEVFNNIENDEEVYLFDKFFAIHIIDIYLNIKFFNILINQFFPSEHNKKRANFPYFLLKDAMDFEKVKETNKQLSYSKHYKIYCKEQTLQPIKYLFEYFLNEYLQQLDFGLSKNEYKKIILNAFSDNTRLIEKNLFPYLYDSLILKKETEKLDDLFETSSYKKILLFDIFPIIIHYRNFRTENQTLTTRRSQESFYEYKINTVRTIIGK